MGPASNLGQPESGWQEYLERLVKRFGEESAQAPLYPKARA